MKKIMLHPRGIEKKIKVGFSWTTFFFQWIPSACRGDIISALKLFFIGIVTLGIYPVVKCFSINKDYEEFLLLKGFEGRESLKEGFSQIKVLEYVAVVLKIVLPIIALIFYIIFMGFIFSGLNSLNSSTNGITTSPAIYDSNTTVHGNKVIQNRNISTSTADVQHVTMSKNDTTADSLEPAPKDDTYKDTGMVAGVVYNQSANVAKTNKQLENISEQISKLYVTYGNEVRTNGGIPTITGENNESLTRVENYYNSVDKILNEQWAVLKEVLAPSAFKTLQEEQIKWINQKETSAKDSEKDSNTEVGKKISYYASMGMDTYRRIAELDNKYLQGI